MEQLNGNARQCIMRRQKKIHDLLVANDMSGYCELDYCEVSD
jgi:hypothetical protein